MFADIPTKDEWKPFQEALEKNAFLRTGYGKLLLEIRDQIAWYPHRPFKYATLVDLRKNAENLFTQIDNMNKRKILHAGKVDLLAGAKGLKEVVEKKLATMANFSTSKYQQVVCIGYE